MALVDLGLGGGASGFAKNQLAKFKEKRAKAKFDQKYSGAKTQPGGPNYLSGYLSTDRSYSNPDRVSYELTDLYPNIDIGFDIRITDRLAWNNDYDNSLQSIFLGEEDRYFRYSYDHESEYSDNNYEDPTILGFNIMVDESNSPLLDFGWVWVRPPKKESPAQNETKKPSPKIEMSDPVMVKDWKWDNPPNDDEKVEYERPARDEMGRDMYKTVKKDGVYVVGGSSGVENTRYLLHDYKSVYDEVWKLYFDQYWDEQKAKQKEADDKKAREELSNSSSDSLSKIPKGSASYWLFNYANMDQPIGNMVSGGYKNSVTNGQSSTWQRFLLLQDFKEMFKSIVPTEFPKKYRRPFYIESIGGLDKLSKPFVEYKKDMITITCTEDIGLRMTYITELYNNIVYSYQHGRVVTPENVLRFDLIIKVSDKRTFNRPKTKDSLSSMEEKGFKFQKTRDFYEPAENAYITYRLHDCNLDFMSSQPHTQEIVNGGIGQGADFQTSVVKFNIYYKSVSKIFYSPLLCPLSPERQGSYYIDNKNNDGYGIAYEEKYNSTTDQQFPTINRADVQDIKYTRGQPLAGTGFFDRLKDSIFGGQTIGGGLISQVGDKVFDGLANAVDSAFDSMLQKGREVRGELISNLTDSVTGGKFIAEIFPTNVYDINLDGVAGDSLSNMTIDDQMAMIGMTLGAQTAKAGLKGLNDLTSF